jgi:hypothetical protein
MGQPRKYSLTKRAMVLLATFLVLLAGVWVWPSAQVTKARYDRIQGGMSLAQVSSIIGGSPGDYTSGPTAVAPGADDVYWWERRSHDREAFWRGDAGRIDVYFHNDHAIAKWFTHFTTRKPLNPIDRLRYRYDRWQESRHPVRE